MLLQELDVVQQFLLVTSQGDTQGGQVSGEEEEGREGVTSGPISLRSQTQFLRGSRSLCPHPASPCLLQAELSHITEGAEAKLGEIVLVALQSNGRQPGLGRVQTRKVQGHRIQECLGRSKGGWEGGEHTLQVSASS